MPLPATVVSPDQNVAQVFFLVALILLAAEFVLALVPPRTPWPTPMAVAGLAFLAAGLLAHG